MGFLLSARPWSDRHLEVACGHDIASSTLGSSAEDLPFLALGVRGTPTPGQLLRVGSPSRAIIRCAPWPSGGRIAASRPRLANTSKAGRNQADKLTARRARHWAWPSTQIGGWLVGSGRRRAAGGLWVVGWRLWSRFRASDKKRDPRTSEARRSGHARDAGGFEASQRTPRSCRPRAASGSSVQRYDPTENWNEKRQAPCQKRRGDGHLAH